MMRILRLAQVYLLPILMVFIIVFMLYVKFITSPKPNKLQVFIQHPKMHHGIILNGVPVQRIYLSGHEDANSHVCPQLGTGIRLLIIIISAPNHGKARIAIRKTWGYFASRRDIAMAFLLGLTSRESVEESIRNEQDLYGDIIRGKFMDSYANLTLKTISMLEWVEKHCPNSDFTLKTDDDMFINVSKLLQFMDELSPQEGAIYGRVWKERKPCHNKKSKYYIPHEQYESETFPDFTSGPAYLFPTRLSKALYEMALNTTYLKLEDVFLTGIVADRLEIPRINVVEFSNRRVYLASCNIKKLISIHKIKSSDQYTVWKRLHDEVNCG